MAKFNLIKDIRKYLIDENIYTPKDEMTLVLLENSYTQYNNSWKEVKEAGQTIQQVDSNGKVRTIINPAYKNLLEAQKQLFKLIDSLYLSPKSRKTKKEDVVEKEDPFLNLINDMKNSNDK